MATVYQINKGINGSIEFRGIKAQYLAFLAVGMVGLLIVCAIAFIAGLPPVIVILAIVAAGFALIVTGQRYSKRYGEHGLAKKIAHARMPAYLTTSSRQVFFLFNEKSHETK